MRSFLAAVLILFAVLLTFPATLAAWEQRVLMNEDRFLGLSQNILSVAAVQEQIARRVQEKVQALAAEEGGELEEQRVADAALKLARELPTSELGEKLLRAAHKLLVRILRADALEYDTLALETKPLIERVKADLGYQIDVSRIEAAEGQGLVLFREEDLPTPVRVARQLDAIATYIVLLPLIVVAAAVLVAPNPALALRYAGLAIALAAVLRILALEVAIKKLITETIVLDAAAEEAALSVQDKLAWSFEQQDVFVLVIGVLFAIAGILLGRTRRARVAAVASTS